MRAFRLVFVLLASTVATANASPLRFELRCNGTQKNILTGETIGWFGGYKVDLITNTWCITNCRQIQPIKEVTAERLVLEDDAPFPGASVRLIADRIMGTIENDVSMTGAMNVKIHDQGTCTSIDFEGFQKF